MSEGLQLKQLLKYKEEEPYFPMPEQDLIQKA
jgi:hypothetical protein